MSNITHTQENQEIWKAITDYPNYEVSTFGRVRSLERINITKTGKTTVRGGRVLKQGTTSRGYKNVGVRNDYGVLTRNVHRLVMETFLPQDVLPIINHIDEDQENNHIDNLEWCTYSHNSTHNDTHIKRSKYVYQYSKEMKLLNIYRTVKEAKKAVDGVTSTGISSAATGKLKTHAGYIWSYTNLHEDMLNSTINNMISMLTNIQDELTTTTKKAA